VVQLPEKIDKTSEAYRSGFYTIADIGKQRIRNFNKQYAQKVKQDLGMKIFKLYSSNIKIWSAPCDDLDQYLLDNSEHVASGRTKQDVLYELLLKRGIDLAAPIDKIVVAGKTVFSVGFGALFACLDELIKKEEIEVLAKGIADWRNELDPESETQVVFRDSAFENDVAKVNMTAILEQSGIKHVRSL
jgi:adenine-specific DNA-methyltransferase